MAATSPNRLQTIEIRIPNEDRIVKTAFSSNSCKIQVLSAYEKIEYESAVRLADTRDFSEGIHAFLEKREPDLE